MVSSEEVRELLYRVGSGELIPKLKNKQETWLDIYCGDVCFLVNGYEVVIFNDCGSWDYVDHVITPDGRRGEFDDWMGNGEVWEQPDDILNFENPEIYKNMKEAFINAS